MKVIDPIAHFCTSHTVWIFLTALLTIDYLFIIASPQNNYGDYAFNFFWFCLLFAPVLVFTGFRNWLQRRLPSSMHSVLWIYNFIIHPLILANWLHSYFNEGILFSGLSIRTGVIYELVLTAGGVLLVTEIAIQFNNNLLQWLNKIRWIQRIGLERGIFLVIILLAIMSGVAGVVELLNNREMNESASFFWYGAKFIFFTFQFTLIGFCYYFFYYANHYILIPKLLKPKGVIYYGFSIAALILVFYPIFVILINWLPAINELRISAFTPIRQVFAKDGGGIPFLIMVLSVPIIISYQWFKQAQEIATLAKEKSETELNLLKQQINPHFFFNTLNNLYALSLKKDPTTPATILQLSELMRYVIYKGKEASVSLAEEVKHIEDYIHLQQLRLYKKMDFHFDKQITDAQLQIPPLLFIILIENAFKHGIEPAENECFLQICIKSDAKTLLFTCKNSVEEKNEKAPGIGLDNLRRRLILRFPNQHELKVEEKENTFTATLKLAL